MDAMDEVWGVTEVSGVVHFIFEENTTNFVRMESRRVDRVGAGEVEVGIEGARLHGKHEVSYRAKRELVIRLGSDQGRLRYLSSPC